MEAGAMGFHGADAPPPAVTEEAIGGRVEVASLSKDEVTQLKKRLREEEEGGVGQPAAKRLPGGKSVLVTLEVRKPEGCVGGLTLGPIAPHQRVIFGRLPSNDVVAEHASISRQHAALSVDASGTLLLTDLQSGAPAAGPLGACIASDARPRSRGLGGCGQAAGSGCACVVGHKATDPAPLCVVVTGATTGTHPSGTLRRAGHGTKLDDTWLRPNAPKPLKQGAVFQLGASTRQYVVARMERK